MLLNANAPNQLTFVSLGHEIVATIAQIYLHPDAHAAVCEILGYEPANPPTCHLASVATWADRVRRVRGFGWSASLHYVGAKDDHRKH
jgi:hypothetical protein